MNNQSWRLKLEKLKQVDELRTFTEEFKKITEKIT